MILEDNTKVQKFFKNAHSKGQISDERKAFLTAIAEKTNDVLLHTNLDIHLNFICTHNSRRSQLAQVWAYYAAIYFDLQQVKVYSGGTAITSFHRNTVKTLQKVGFHFNIAEFNHQNPKYLISFDKNTKPLLGYSKLYDDENNCEPYIAITTCNNADENCPFIPSAIWRFHLPYNDPKEFDNTKKEEKAYLITSQQIASEIFFLFKELKKLQA